MQKLNSWEIVEGCVIGDQGQEMCLLPCPPLFVPCSLWSCKDSVSIREVKGRREELKGLGQASGQRPARGGHNFGRQRALRQKALEPDRPSSISGGRAVGTQWPAEKGCCPIEETSQKLYLQVTFRHSISAVLNLSTLFFLIQIKTSDYKSITDTIKV